MAPSTVTHWLLSSGVTGAVSVALGSVDDAAAEVLLDGGGPADVDAVVVLLPEQPVISVALIATAANKTWLTLNLPQLRFGG